MVAISKKYVTIGVAIATIAAIAIALVYSQKKKIAYNALASSAAEGLAPRIIGGEALDQGVWDESRRYLVSIRGVRQDGSDVHTCGATLVSPRVVLTAAHCFTVPGSTDFMPMLSIQFNRYFRLDNEGVTAIQLCPTEDNICVDTNLAYVIRKPEYVNIFEGDDVAMIILPEEQQITNISPVKLNRDPDVPVDGQELEAFGWGQICQNSDWTPAPSGTPAPTPFHNCPDGTDPDEIYTGKLEYTIYAECIASTDLLCAKTDSTNGVATGRGDSGGPLVILDEFGGSLQVGVVSFGFAGFINGTDINPEIPDYFARISFLYDWIQDTVCAEVPSDEVFCLASTPSSPTTSTPSSPTTESPSPESPAKSSKSSKSPTSKPSESSQPTVSPTKEGKSRK